MIMAASRFRKKVVALLERAIRGNGKLARAKRQRTLLVDPDSIVASDTSLLADMKAAWQEDWREI